MKIDTYQLRERLDDVRVYELATVDIPVTTVLNEGLIDLGKTMRLYGDIGRRAGVSIEPGEMTPILPVDFSYRSSTGEVETLRGAVVSEDPTALAAFALERLEEVPRGEELSETLSRDSDVVRKSCGLREFVYLLDDRPREEYRVSPLIQLPSKEGENSGKDSETWFREDQIGDKSLLLLKQKCFFQNWNHLSKVGIPRQIAEGPKSQVTIFLSASREVDSGDSVPSIPTREFVIFTFTRINWNRWQYYQWSSGGERGKTKNVNNLPGGLLKRLDEQGEFNFSNQKFWAPLDSSFFQPELIVGGRQADILDASESSVEIEDLNERVPGNCLDRLDKVSAAVETKQISLERVVDELYCPEPDSSDPRKSSEQGMDEENGAVPVLKDPKLAAHVFGRIEGDVYAPERAQAGINFIDADSREAWVVLGGLGMEVKG